MRATAAGAARHIQDFALCVKSICRKNGAIAPKRSQGAAGARWRELRKKVFERDGYKCQICKSRGVLTVVTLHGSLHGVCDHIVPLAWGGTDAMSNLQTICQACDAEKSKQESIKGRVGSKP